jgi:hypothetical protein
MAPAHHSGGSFTNSPNVDFADPIDHLSIHSPLPSPILRAQHAPVDSKNVGEAQGGSSKECLVDTDSMTSTNRSEGNGNTLPLLPSGALTHREVRHDSLGPLATGRDSLPVYSRHGRNPVEAGSNGALNDLEEGGYEHAAVGGVSREEKKGKKEGERNQSADDHDSDDNSSVASVESLSSVDSDLSFESPNDFGVYSSSADSTLSELQLYQARVGQGMDARDKIKFSYGLTSVQHTHWQANKDKYSARLFKALRALADTKLSGRDRQIQRKLKKRNLKVLKQVQMEALIDSQNNLRLRFESQPVPPLVAATGGLFLQTDASFEGRGMVFGDHSQRAGALNDQRTAKGTGNALSVDPLGAFRPL